MSENEATATCPIAMDARRRSERRLLPRIGDFLYVALMILLTWQERSRQRRHLAALSDRALRDIGLSRADISNEADKPFWRP